ncbi:hypothetical protein GM708_00885 [Vibrio cholerae]|nr:hypothetical protein [Vibrio cholerae]
MVIGCVPVFLFLAVGPRFVGYQTATMLTGSMAPDIVPGDVLGTTHQPVTEVIRNPDGTTAVRTKGGAIRALRTPIISNTLVGARAAR